LKFINAYFNFLLILEVHFHHQTIKNCIYISNSFLIYLKEFKKSDNFYAGTVFPTPLTSSVPYFLAIYYLIITITIIIKTFRYIYVDKDPWKDW